MFVPVDATNDSLAVAFHHSKEGGLGSTAVRSAGQIAKEFYTELGHNGLFHITAETPKVTVKTMPRGF